MNNYNMKVLLFFIALIPTTILTALWLPTSIIYHLVTGKWKKGTKNIGNYFWQMALSIDQFANVSLQTPLNYLMTIGEEYHKFGDEDDTISYVIAMNRNKGTLSSFGDFWATFLDFVDKDHLDKAIKNKVKRDMEAIKRLSGIELTRNEKEI